METGQEKLGLLRHAVMDNIPKIIEIESKYLSELNKDNPSINTVSEKNMKSNELRKLLSNIFTEYNAFHGNNTGSFDMFDYKINYQYLSCILQEGQRTYILDIDIWGKSTIKVDELADEIEGLLNYQSIRTRKLCHILFRKWVSRDEKNIYRRTLTYEVRTYEEGLKK